MGNNSGLNEHLIQVFMFLALIWKLEQSRLHLIRLSIKTHSHKSYLNYKLFKYINIIKISPFMNAPYIPVYIEYFNEKFEIDLHVFH